jgi:hypothetical protein
VSPVDPSEIWREVTAQETLRLGELALALGKITPRQLEKALARQQDEPSPRKLAEILEEQGALTPTQSAELLLELERHAGKSAHPRIDRFLLLLHELGRGGMGVVWEAWDTKLNRAVALKVLRVDQELERACLLREARMAGQLSHPNIPATHEILDHQGSPCIAMSLIRGTRLDEAARRLARSQASAGLARRGGGETSKALTLTPPPLLRATPARTRGVPPTAAGTTHRW